MAAFPSKYLICSTALDANRPCCYASFHISSSSIPNSLQSLSLSRLWLTHWITCTHNRQCPHENCITLSRAHAPQSVEISSGFSSKRFWKVAWSQGHLHHLIASIERVRRGASKYTRRLSLLLRYSILEFTWIHTKCRIVLLLQARAFVHTHSSKQVFSPLREAVRDHASVVALHQS
jgi:hypothetical protein